MSDEWVETTLGAVADICGGGTPSTSEPTYWGGDVIWLTPTEVVKKDGTRIDTSERTITEVGLARSSAKLLPTNTVLLTSRASVGFVALADRPLATNQGFQSLIAKVGISPEFLMLWIQGNREEFRKRAGGSTFQEISKSNVASIPISVPPLDTQRRIVDLMAILDKHLANLRREYETSLTLLERARIEMTDNWPKIPLREVCSIQALLVDPRAPEHSGRLHIGIDRIVKDIGELLPLTTAAEEKLISGKYLFGPLDIIYSKIRPNLRKVAFPGTEGLCSADAYPLTPTKGIPSELLREVLLLPSVVDTVVGKSGRTKMPKVNRRELFEVLIPMSADSEERLAISQHLKKIREVCRTLNLEVRAFSLVRERCLTSLLLNEIDLPESYDTFLAEVA